MTRPGPLVRRAVVVPALLLVVAAVQATRVVTVDQSSWQGAGFGMFATYDFDDTRAVVAIVEHRDGTREVVPVDAAGRDLLVRARVTPTDAVLRRVAERVAPTLSSTARRLTIAVRAPRLEDGAVTFSDLNDVTVDG